MNPTRASSATSFAEAPDVLTVAEVARLLRLDRNNTYRLVNSGAIYGRRIGRVVRIPKAAVIRYLEGQPEPGTAAVG